jgi:integrase/recombinase XerD
MELLSAYLHDCEVRNLTCRTIQSYKSSSKKYLEYLDEHNIDPLQIKQDDLIKYIEHLNGQIKPSTIQRDFAAINGFYKFLKFKKLITDNPIPEIAERYIDHNYEPDVRFIPELEDVRAVLHAIENEPEDMIREITIICFLAKTLTRRGECFALKDDSIDLDRDIIYWERSKKKRVRVGLIDDELHDFFEAYFEWREPRAKTDWLWVTDRGYRLKEDHINDILAHYATPLGLHIPGGELHQKFTCHCIRGFGSTFLERSGMKEMYIHWLRGDSMKKSALRGHYIKFDQEIVRKGWKPYVPKLSQCYLSYKPLSPSIQPLYCPELNITDIDTYSSYRSIC